MALLIGDNFNYQGQKPNFERDSFDTLESMISYPETSIDDGHISYCKETKKHYIYDSSNESTNTGKWKELSKLSNGSGIVNVNNLSEDIQNFFNEVFVLTTGGTITTYSQTLEYLKGNGNHLWCYTFDESSSAYTYALIACKEDGTITVAIDPIFSTSEDNYMTSIMYVLVGNTGLIQDKKIRSSSLSISDSGDVSVSLDTTNGEDVNETSIMLNVSGNGTKFLADNGTYKEIDTKGPIKDFNDAPEVVKTTFAAAMVGTTHIDNYTELAEAVGNTTTTYLYNTADSGSTGFSNFYVTVGHYNEHILYTIFSPMMPAAYFANLSGYIAIDSTGNVERHDYTNLIQVTTDGISIHATGSALADDRDITLKTEGTGNQFLADNGQYKTITSSDSVIKSFSNAPQVIKNIVGKMSEIINSSDEPVQFPVAIDYYDELVSTVGNKTQCYIIDNLNDISTEGYENQTPYYVYLWNVDGRIWVNMYAPAISLPNTQMAQYTAVVETTGITQAYGTAYYSNAMNGEIVINAAFTSLGTDANQSYNEQITFKANGNGNKYLGDDGKYHEIKQVSSYGTTAERPSNVSIGFQYFDTDLNRPIWWNGTEWVGATDANIVKLTQAQYEELPTKDPDTIYFIKG